MLEIDFIKRIKSQINKKNKYLFNLNAYEINYLRIIRITFKRGSLLML